MIGIIGAGGHSRVVSDIYKNNKQSEKIMYFTSNEKIVRDNEIFLDTTNTLLQFKPKINGWHVAIGSVYTRKQKIDYLEKNNFKIIQAIHSKSIIADTAFIGIGTSVMAGAVINPYVQIGKGCIINTASSIDHDCKIGDYVNIGPGSRLAGGVTVGDLTELGTGVIIIPNIKIGGNCIIGAGAVVINDIPDNSVAVGVPAKAISTVEKNKS